MNWNEIDVHATVRLIDAIFMLITVYMIRRQPKDHSSNHKRFFYTLGGASFWMIYWPCVAYKRFKNKPKGVTNGIL